MRKMQKKERNTTLLIFIKYKKLESQMGKLVLFAYQIFLIQNQLYFFPGRCVFSQKPNEQNRTPTIIQSVILALFLFVTFAMNPFVIFLHNIISKNKIYNTP